MLLERRASTTCSRATSAGPRACAPRCSAWGLPIQCADPARYSPVLTGVIMPAGVDADAVRQADLRALRPVARHRPRQGQGPHVPHRPPRRLQRPHADGHARRLRDGPEARRRARWPAAACRPPWTTSRAIRHARGSLPPPSRGRASSLSSLHRSSQDERMQRRTFLQAGGAAVATLAAPRLLAQEWPNAPVRIVVGFPPGGGTDALARVVAAEADDDVEPAGHRRDQGRRRRRARRRVRGAAAERRQRRC